MARPRSKTLTEAEHRIMDALWRLGQGSVREVAEALPPLPALAYNTVSTMLRILEEKGYVAHQKEGRAFLYRSLVGRDEARRSAVEHLLGRFFAGSAGALAVNLLEAESLDRAELAQLRSMLDDSEDRE